MSSEMDRVRVLEIAIRNAMKMCGSKKHTKQEVYDILAQAIENATDMDEDFLYEMNENEHLLWWASDHEHTVYASPH